MSPEQPNNQTTNKNILGRNYTSRVRGVFERIHDGLETKGGKLTVGGLIVLGSLGLAGCGENVSGPSQLSGTSSETAPTPPSSSPEASATPEWFYPQDIMERTPLPAELQKYKDMPVDKFKALPKKEQWVYVSWLTQYRSQFEKWYATSTGQTKDKPVILNPDSPVEDIVSDVMYSFRLATYASVDAPVPTEDGFCGTLDVDSMTKIVDATYMDPNSSEPDVQAANIISGSGNRAVCPSTQAQSNLFAVSKLGNMTSTRSKTNFWGEQVTTEQVNYTAPDGKDYTFKAIVLPITTYTGETQFVTVTDNTLIR